MKRNANPYDLTADEVALLKSSTTPDLVKHYLARQHENIGTKITAYQKVAAAARSEADALLAVQRLEDARGVMIEVHEARGIIAAQAQRLRSIEAQLVEKDDAITALRAEQALAIHSNG